MPRNVWLVSRFCKYIIFLVSGTIICRRFNKELPKNLYFPYNVTPVCNIQITPDFLVSNKKSVCVYQT